MNKEVNNNEWQRTTVALPEKMQRKWYVVDLKEKIVGRVAVIVSKLLRGKDKNLFTPNVDMGDFVVAINASSLKHTGKRKLKQRVYFHHTRWPGGLKKETAGEMMEKKPTKLFSLVVKGMMPDNSLTRKQLTRLFIFEDSKHNLKAQEKAFIPFLE